MVTGGLYDMHGPCTGMFSLCMYLVYVYRMCHVTGCHGDRWPK